MKNRGTIALTVLFFAGLVGLWLADSLQVPNAAERERQRGRILTGLANLKPDDLRKIEIEGKAGDPALVFERRAGQKWQMTSPLDVAANPSLVEGLAVTLKGLTRKPEAATQTGDPAHYGLAPASKTVRLWGQNTDTPLATLELGDVNLDRRFVRAGVAGIEVVPARGLEVVDLPPVRWRDHELFRVPTFEVDAVTVASPDRNLRFERSRDAWRITNPIQTLADEAKIEGMVASIGSLRVTNDAQYVANDVAKADLDRYGLAQPTLTITVTSGRGADQRPPQILEVGKPVENQPDRLYVRNADQNDVIAIDARILNDLKKVEPNEFRIAKVADIAPNRATRFRVESGAESFEIARSGNTWFLTHPSVGRADSKAVQEFFQTLEGLRTTLYLPPSKATEELSGLSKPSTTIQVWQTLAARPATAADSAATPEPIPTAGDPATFTLRIGKRDVQKKAVYVQVGDDPTVLILPDSLTDNLFKHSWAYRDRLFLAVATDQIERVEFDGLGKRVMLQAPILKLEAFKNAPVGWWMSEPVAAPADRDAVTKLFKLLGAFRVDGFAAESPPSLASFGLDAPSLKVTWSTPTALPPTPLRLPPSSDPNSRTLRFDEQTLLIGSLVPDRRAMRYAKLAGSPVVFMLGGENLAALDAEWHEHQVLQFDPTEVSKVHLNWPGSSWSFDVARTEGVWSIVGPIDVPGFDPAAATSIIQAASALTATRFIQYQGAIPATVGMTPPRLVLLFSGEKFARPVELVLGSLTDPTQGCASVPQIQPGAVFLTKFAPFVPWLQIQPALRDGLPEDVFHREPTVTASPTDRPGQTTGQSR